MSSRYPKTYVLAKDAVGAETLFYARGGESLDEVAWSNDLQEAIGIRGSMMLDTAIRKIEKHYADKDEPAPALRILRVRLVTMTKMRFWKKHVLKKNQDPRFLSPDVMQLADALLELPDEPNETITVKEIVGIHEED